MAGLLAVAKKPNSKAVSRTDNKVVNAYVADINVTADVTAMRLPNGNTRFTLYVVEPMSEGKVMWERTYDNRGCLLSKYPE